MKTNILNVTKIIVLALIIGFGVNYIYANFTVPHSTPPTCITDPANANYDPGCLAPINVGAAGQIKTGGLTLNTGGLSESSLILRPTFSLAGNLTGVALIERSGNIGIGVINPLTKLDVSGKIKATSLQITGSTKAGQVLTSSDTNGNMTWVDATTGTTGGSTTSVLNTNTGTVDWNVISNTTTSYPSCVSRTGNGVCTNYFTLMSAIGCSSDEMLVDTILNSSFTSAPALIVHHRGYCMASF